MVDEGSMMLMHPIYVKCDVVNKFSACVILLCCVLTYRYIVSLDAAIHGGCLTVIAGDSTGYVHVLTKPQNEALVLRHSRRRHELSTTRVLFTNDDTLHVSIGCDGRLFISPFSTKEPTAANLEWTSPGIRKLTALEHDGVSVRHIAVFPDVTS